MYDEDGYGGPVDLLANIALAYERLAALQHPAYADEATAGVCGAQSVLLFSCDHGDWETPNCSIDKEERAEWTAVIDAHPDSSTAKVAKAFLKKMKAKRYRASSGQLFKLVEPLLDCVEE